MRRGCISLGNIKCEECQRLIKYPERYMYLEESDGKSVTLCLDCCESKGLLKDENHSRSDEPLFDLSEE